jgi:transcription elongation factor GreA
VALPELRDLLSQIVAEPQWSAWWTRAKKDPRLITGSGTKPKLSWNDSISDGLSNLKSQFLQASPYDKIEMLKKHAKRDEKLVAEMGGCLVEDANKAVQSDPGLALEIALILGDFAKGKDLVFYFSVKDILARPDAATIISGIKDRIARRAAISSVKQAGGDWAQTFISLLQTESDAQILSSIYNGLSEHENPELLEAEVHKTLLEPASAPRFYLWLCKEMAQRPEIKRFAGWDFVLALMGSLDDPAFKGHHAALRKLFDLGEAADWAISAFDAVSGRRFLDALSRDRGLEDYRKDRLRKELHQRYPELHETKQNALYMTKEALEKKRIEFEKLVREDIPNNTKEIQRTREYGDLRENFEYHAARHRQEMLSSRAKSLHDELNAAREIDPSAIDTSKISIGTRCRLRPASGSGDAVELTILGPWDSDPSKNILSYTSVAGAALLNSLPNANVVYNETEYIVDAIVKWV